MISLLHAMGKRQEDKDFPVTSLAVPQHSEYILLASRRFLKSTSYIHSSTDGHLCCFHVLAIIYSAVMNTGVHVSLSLLVSSDQGSPDLPILCNARSSIVFGLLVQQWRQ